MMNPPQRDGWPLSQALSAEQHQGKGGRTLTGHEGNAGGQHQQQQQQQPQNSGPVLPPPSGQPYAMAQPPRNLPTLTNITQTSPSQPSQRAAPSHHEQPAAVQHVQQQPPQTGGFSLPALNQALAAPPQPQPGYDRDRDPRDAREQEAIEKRLAEDHANRDRERAQQHLLRDIERRQEYEQRGAAPAMQTMPPHQVPPHQSPSHQTHAGPIHLHQPVAIGPQSRAIHGPNGLLSNSGPATMPGSFSGSLGAPPGPGNIFGGPLQQSESQRASQPVANPQQQVAVPYGSAQAQAQQNAAMSMSQGQQPILNDALSYLDQVKVQFVEHPDVYNRFLDIMKDFKSGVIDTPGVINRVSSLFAGNPALIQGFNTFLPPGYKIECGTGENRDTIRVTTPMGTTVSSMPVPRPFSNPRNGVAYGNVPPPNDRQYYDGAGASALESAWAAQHGAPPHEMLVSPEARIRQPQYAIQGAPSATGAVDGHPSDQAGAGGSNANGMLHQQEHRAVSQLQIAMTAAAGANMMRPGAVSPSGGSATNMPGQQPNGSGLLHPQGAQNAGVEKRGPVEFNHAINYVNKIKNRYATQPDIYKQFLEILQTYQRESKPIQEVYSQVTVLFNQAPDLLEDFKQFLPESAAQAKAAAARQAAEEAATLSNVRGDAGYGVGGNPQAQHTPRPDQNRMPPVGSFAPTPSASNRDKRKRFEKQSAIPAPAILSAGGGGYPADSNPRGAAVQPTMAVNKRLKQQHVSKQNVPEGPAVSPTLTPALPEPMPPTTTAGATAEEIAFFDKVKKFINNKHTMNEFLKICNLFSQDLIDKAILVHRAQSFIGGNPDLMNWFKKFLGYENKEDVIENKVRPATGRVSLANCRGLGPSYRLLPKLERIKPCSGRDELCHEVLNDEWASHPTWASEDSGFVAHRKNTHEEALHRIEEERHDYDFNIEACAKTIQLMEPIAQQLSIMTPDEQVQFTLPPGLGGQSETIYKRVIMKLYGRDKGQYVIHHLFATPYNVIPVLLNRLKQKLEEWKAGQREWEKVWREQTQKMFWKSLDHQGIGQRLADKRQFQTKTLQNEIHVKYEEQKRQREIQRLTVPRYQFSYQFDDVDVLMDVSQLVLTYAEQGHTSEFPRLMNFIKEFVPLFFGLDQSKFEQRIVSFNHDPPTADEGEEDVAVEGSSSPKQKRTNGRKGDLLRGVLDRGRSGRSTRSVKEESVAPGSRGSTPEVTSAADEDMNDADSMPPQSNGSEPEKWLEHPTGGNLFEKRDLVPNEPYKRDTYNMYCNVHIYCFFRMFVILYERLYSIKANEADVHENVRRAKDPKPALDLKMVDKLPQDFFADTSPSANYYQQIMGMLEDQVKGEVDMSHIEETLRRYHLQTGWQLYSFERLLSALVRFAIALLGADAKDKSWEIYQLFRKDRVREETTHQDELNYRKQVDKYAKEGDIYKISFTQSTLRACLQVFKKDEATFENQKLSPENRWSYYISSFTNLEPTEGVPVSKIHMPIVRRAGYDLLDEITADDGENGTGSGANGNDSGGGSGVGNAYGLGSLVSSSENLVIRVCLENYKMLFAPRTDEWMTKSHPFQSGGKEWLKKTEMTMEKRGQAVKEMFVSDNTWMKGAKKDDVEAAKEEFKRAVKGPGAGGDGDGPERENMNIDNSGKGGDEEMADVS